MALVHNGDFANYHSVTEYLKQRNIYPQFLTDTEVSALLFDLLARTYHYPLEYIIEALAPTTELDFDKLPAQKRGPYRAIQASHIHGSPDGPWFFIIARNNPGERQFQLMGITDTAMLRPQVFAFHDGGVQVGLICSEKQAIDATLHSLSKDDIRICPVADRYWNARGGSHTDGGAFIFNLTKDPDGNMRILCADKFGVPVAMPGQTEQCDFTKVFSSYHKLSGKIEEILRNHLNGDPEGLYQYIRKNISEWSFEECGAAFRLIGDDAADDKSVAAAVKALTMLNDSRYSTGSKKRNHIIHLLRSELRRIFSSLPHLSVPEPAVKSYRLIDRETRKTLRGPAHGGETLVINAAGFAPEGNDSDATLLLDAYMKGWKRFIVFGCTGQRFTGCGLGPETDGVTIDVYDSAGDYLASGIDGLTITVHNNAQDQLAQIIKRGKFVVHGDVGQTFMYGAKGGEIYVLGNAAGRPLINSVGKPRVIINGTCLDFLGESFMAGDPHAGGGFVILNGIRLDDEGNTAELKEPYPGSNLFSLASGGAVFVRDPRRTIVYGQLNGGDLRALNHRKVVPQGAGHQGAGAEDDDIFEECTEEEAVTRAG